MGIGRRISSEETQGPQDPAPQMTQPEYSMADLILPATTRAALLDFLAYQHHESMIFDQWGLANTHARKRQTAVNLYGPPGTGKTMAAHAIAHEAGRPIIMVNYADLESKYVGETSKNITRLFEDAKKHRAIIFFDEADAILSRRVTNMTQATDVSVNQTRSVMLILMNQHDGLVIFATNFIENYDPAFMRRILAHIDFAMPDEDCRSRLWGKYIPDQMPHDADVQHLTARSAGLSGSDISNCVLKAALAAARQGSARVSKTHFEVAIEEIRKSKSANGGEGIKAGKAIERREVSESHVAEQLGQQTMESLKS